MKRPAKKGRARGKKGNEIKERQENERRKIEKDRGTERQGPEARLRNEKWENKTEGWRRREERKGKEQSPLCSNVD